MDRETSDTDTTQGMLATTRGWKNQGRHPPLDPLEERSTLHTLISDVWPPKL